MMFFLKISFYLLKYSNTSSQNMKELMDITSNHPQLFPIIKLKRLSRLFNSYQEFFFCTFIPRIFFIFEISYVFYSVHFQFFISLTSIFSAFPSILSNSIFLNSYFLKKKKSNFSILFIYKKEFSPFFGKPLTNLSA